MYEDRRLPNLEEMKECAWELRTKSAGSRAGFVLASEIQKLENDGQDVKQKTETVPEETPAIPQD